MALIDVNPTANAVTAKVKVDSAFVRSEATYNEDIEGTIIQVSIADYGDMRVIIPDALFTSEFATANPTFTKAAIRNFEAGAFLGVGGVGTGKTMAGKFSRTRVTESGTRGLYFVVTGLE